MERRARRLVLAAAAAPIVVWAPALAATHYGGQKGAAMLARPDRGWHFLADAVGQSRGARLGWSGAALSQAKDRWVSNPRAGSVHLRWSEDPIAINTVGRGGTPIVRTVRTRSPLTWIVTGGRLADGRPRTIGLMDYRSGQVFWSVNRQVGQ